MRLYNAFPLAQIDDVSLAAMTRVDRKDVAKTRQAFLTKYRDPAQAQAVLDELPAPSLVVLAALVDAGGMLSIAALANKLSAEHAMSKMDLQRAVSPLAERLLVVPLSSDRGDQSVLALVAPAAQAIAPFLIDLDIAPSDDVPFVADPDPAIGARVTLAVCMALRHADLKRTNDGRPHRAATKRLAKQIGLDEVSIARVIEVAEVAGLVGVDPELTYRPDPTAIAAAIAGRYRDPVMAAIVERLENGPVAIGVVDRWRRHLLTPFIDPAALAMLPGIASGTLGGLAALAFAVDAKAAAAGHVTPSFEVLLPPESRLADIVAIVGCCELVRVDRVIVGKLTHASVARAVAAGSTGAEIVAALAAASKVPIPQNVEHAVRDWAGGASSAIVTAGVVVSVAPALADKVRAALAHLEPRDLGNGAFVFEHAVSRREIDVALAKAGVQPRRELVTGSPSIARREIPPIDQGSPALRARVAAWRRDDPAERKRDRDVDRFVPLGAESGIPSVKQVDDAIEALAVWQQAHRRLPPDELKIVVGLFASLPRTLWQPLLDRSTNTDQLRDAIAALVESGAIDAELANMGLRRPGVGSAASPDDTDVVWFDDHLIDRITEAVPDEIIAIEHAGRITELAFDRVIKRGAASLVLGEDLDTGEQTAIRLAAITRVAFLDDVPPPMPAGSTRPEGPYRGPPIAGHLPCPCGSGKRYRDCCRGAAS